MFSIRLTSIALLILLAGSSADGQPWLRAKEFDALCFALDESASPGQKAAADELAQYWEKVTNHPVAGNCVGAPADAVKVYIGLEQVPAALLDSPPFAHMGADAILVRTVPASKGHGKALILAGKDDQGTRFAVYEFLDRALGVRWLTPDFTHIPAPPKSIGAIDCLYEPQIKRRVMSYADFGWHYQTEAGNYTPAMRDAAFRHFRLSAEPHFGLFVHTAFTLLPPQKYFLEHPEYYSEINGERRGPVIYDDEGNPTVLPDYGANKMGADYPDLRTQLCFSNPDVAEEIIRELKPRMRANPDATVWGVSQMDWSFPCECAACTAINEREGTAMGALLTCVNRVADGIREEFPDKYIETLAYAWSRKPPRTIKPRDNVIISLCNIECNMIYPMDSPRDPLNKDFGEDLKGWGKIAKNLFFWDYPDNCLTTMNAYPNFHVLQRNMKLWADNNAMGAFLCGGEVPQMGLGALRAYLLAKLLWNPDCDYEALKDEFITLYYGKAAPHVQEYIDWMTKSALQRGALVHVHDFGDWLDYDVVMGANAILDEAVAAAETPETRLRAWQLWVRNQFPAMYAQPRITLRDGLIEALRPPTIGLDAIVRELDHWKVPDFRGRPMKDALSGWAFQEKVPRLQESAILSLENQHTLVWVAPDLGGAVIRWQDKSSGEELFGDVVNQPAPYRFLSLQEWATGGSSAPETPAAPHYAVVSKSSEEITLRAALDNGLQLDRHLTLLPDERGIQVDVKVSNPKGEPLSPRIKLHPEFHILVKGHPIIWAERNGQWENLNPQREPTRLTVGHMVEPEGVRRWGYYVPSKNLTLLNEFTPDEVGNLYFFLGVMPFRYHVNLELLMNNAPLAPGEHREIRSRYTLQEGSPA